MKKSHFFLLFFHLILESQQTCLPEYELFSDFSQNFSNASPNSSLNSCYLLAPASKFSLWNSARLPLNRGFKLNISLNFFENAFQGEGFAIIFQDSPLDFLAIGDKGAGLGYAGLSRIFAIEFDRRISFEKGDLIESHLSIIARKNSRNFAEERDSISGQIAISREIAQKSLRILVEYAKPQGKAAHLRVILAENCVFDRDLPHSIDFFTEKAEVFVGLTGASQETAASPLKIEEFLVFLRKIELLNTIIAPITEKFAIEQKISFEFRAADSCGLMFEEVFVDFSRFSVKVSDSRACTLLKSQETELFAQKLATFSLVCKEIGGFSLQIATSFGFLQKSPFSFEVEGRTAAKYAVFLEKTQILVGSDLIIQAKPQDLQGNPAKLPKLEEIDFFLADPLQKVYNFNENASIFAETYLDNSEKTVKFSINSRKTGDFAVFSSQMLTPSPISLSFVAEVAEKLVNPTFSFEMDEFSRVLLRISFSLADKFDNLLEFSELFALKTSVLLRNELDSRDLEAVPQNFDSENKLIFRYFFLDFPAKKPFSLRVVVPGNEKLGEIRSLSCENCVIYCDFAIIKLEYTRFFLNYPTFSQEMLDFFEIKSELIPYIFIVFHSQKLQIFSENLRKPPQISATLSVFSQETEKNYSLSSSANKIWFNFSVLGEIFSENREKNATLFIKIEYLSQFLDKRFAISFKIATETPKNQQVSLKNSNFLKEKLSFPAAAYFLDVFSQENSVDLVLRDKNGGIFAEFVEISATIRVIPSCMLNESLQEVEVLSVFNPATKRISLKCEKIEFMQKISVFFLGETLEIPIKLQPGRASARKSRKVGEILVNLEENRPRVFVKMQLFDDFGNKIARTAEEIAREVAVFVENPRKNADLRVFFQENTGVYQLDFAADSDSFVCNFSIFLNNRRFVEETEYFLVNLQGEYDPQFSRVFGPNLLRIRENFEYFFTFFPKNRLNCPHKIERNTLFAVLKHQENNETLIKIEAFTNNSAQNPISHSFSLRIPNKTRAGSYVFQVFSTNYRESLSQLANIRLFSDAKQCYNLAISRVSAEIFSSKPFEIWLISLDFNENPLFFGGIPVNLSLETQFLQYSVHDFGNGSYKCEAVAQKAGNFSLKVSFFDEILQKTVNLLKEITVLPFLCHPKHSFLTAEICVFNQLCSVKLRCFDENNNAILQETRRDSLQLFAQNYPDFSENPSDFRENSYVFTFLADVSGPYLLYFSANSLSSLQNSQLFHLEVRTNFCGSSNLTQCPGTFLCNSSVKACFPGLFPSECAETEPFFCERRGIPQCVAHMRLCDCPKNFIFCSFLDKCLSLKDFSQFCPQFSRKCPPEAPFSCENSLNCRENPRDCPSSKACPAGLRQCADESCRENLENCDSLENLSKSCRNHACLPGFRTCVSLEEDCPAQKTCNFPRNVVCPDGRCAENELFCEFSRVFAKDGIVCRANQALCEDDFCRDSCENAQNSTKSKDFTGFFRCPAGTVHCDDHSCKEHARECPRNDCERGFYKCWDSSCAETESLCPSAILCPLSKPYKCPDGSCVSQENACFSVQCPQYAAIICADGSCSASREECPCYIRCPETKPFFCLPLRKCVENQTFCVFPEEIQRCPSFLPHKCKDFSCRAREIDCPTQVSCPPERPFFCETRSKCVFSRVFCTNPNQTQENCFDGSLADHFPCGTSKTCSFRFPIKCEDGSCRGSLEDCPQFFCENRDSFVCHASSQCVSAENRDFCKKTAVCPLETPVKCPDGACVDGIEKCEHEKSQFFLENSQKCRGNSQYFRCFGGLCVDSKAFCPLFLDNYTRFCEEQRFMCSNGECVRNEEDCEEVLQGNREKNCSLQGFIRCENTGECVLNQEDCLENRKSAGISAKQQTAQICFAPTPILCPDGSCQANSSFCQREVFLGNCPINSPILCNNSCVRSSLECVDFSAETLFRLVEFKLEISLYRDYNLGLLFNSSSFLPLISLLIPHFSLFPQKTATFRLEISFVSEEFLKNTSFEYESKGFSRKSADFLEFLAYPLGLSLSLGKTSENRSVFKENWTIVLVDLWSKVGNEYCLAKLIGNSWKCLDNFQKKRDQINIFKFYLKEQGVFSLINIPERSTGFVSSNCKDFACEYPGAIAGIIIFGVFAILLSGFCLRIYIRHKRKRDSVQNLLLMTLFNTDGSFSQSPNNKEKEKESMRNRVATGVPLKNIFEGIKFTMNPLNDYQGFENKAKIWQMELTEIEEKKSD